MQAYFFFIPHTKKMGGGAGQKKYWRGSNKIQGGVVLKNIFFGGGGQRKCVWRSQKINLGREVSQNNWKEGINFLAYQTLASYKAQAMLNNMRS